MTITETLAEFKKLDNKLNEIDKNGGVSVLGYGKTQFSNKYEETLKESQALYRRLEMAGVNPFAEV